MKKKNLLVFFDCVGLLSFLMALVFIGIELYDQHIIAQQRALDIPDTSDHIVFLIRVFVTSGIASASLIAASLLERKLK